MSNDTELYALSDKLERHFSDGVSLAESSWMQISMFILEREKKFHKIISKLKEENAALKQSLNKEK